MTQLYRQFDRNGVLLYIGVSECASTRLVAHKYISFWGIAIDRITVEEFSTREEALKAEQEAIQRENPLYNLVHSLRGSNETIEQLDEKTSKPKRCKECWEVKAASEFHKSHSRCKVCRLTRKRKEYHADLKLSRLIERTSYHNRKSDAAILRRMKKLGIDIGNLAKV